jgi:hypothetical protein
MGLERWHIIVKFEPEKDEASCDADDEYLWATLTFDLSRIDPDYDEDYVRHELAHCLMWELGRVGEHLARKDRNALELVRAASERCTTLVERMPVWGRKA